MKRTGRRRSAFCAIQLLMFIAPEAFGEDLGTVAVSGTSNMWGAGYVTPPDPGGTGGGSLPPSVALTPGSGRILRFSNASGAVDFGACCAPSMPDGETFGLFVYANYGGIAGGEVARVHHLAGVFLTDAEPSQAPPQLVISDVSFSEIEPGIGQVFFVGDGLTGTGSGASQTFRVPAGATRLFLGYLDCFVPCTVPGGYADNSGSVSIDVEQLSVASVPLLPASSAVALGAVLLTVGILSIHALVSSGNASRRVRPALDRDRRSGAR